VEAIRAGVKAGRQVEHPVTTVLYGRGNQVVDQFGAGHPPPPVACQAGCGRGYRVAPRSGKTFGERVGEQRIMARGFSGAICRHPASSIGHIRNQRLRHGAFLSWTLHVNGGRVETIAAPKGAERHCQVGAWCGRPSTAPCCANAVPAAASRCYTPWRLSTSRICSLETRPPSHRWRTRVTAVSRASRRADASAKTFSHSS